MNDNRSVSKEYKTLPSQPTLSFSVSKLPFYLFHFDSQKSSGQVQNMASHQIV